MLVYLLTALSFLAEHLGWFDGMSQTEIFFWFSVGVYTGLAVLFAVLFFVWGTLKDRALFGGFAGTVAIISTVASGLIGVLFAWICTQLWDVDFFLAYQLFAIGIATASFFPKKKREDENENAQS